MTARKAGDWREFGRSLRALLRFALAECRRQFWEGVDVGMSRGGTIPRSSGRLRSVPPPPRGRSGVSTAEAADALSALNVAALKSGRGVLAMQILVEAHERGWISPADLLEVSTTYVSDPASFRGHVKIGVDRAGYDGDVSSVMIFGDPVRILRPGELDNLETR